MKSLIESSSKDNCCKYNGVVVLGFLRNFQFILLLVGINFKDNDTSHIDTMIDIVKNKNNIITGI